MIAGQEGLNKVLPDNFLPFAGIVAIRLLLRSEGYKWLEFVFIAYFIVDR